MLLRCARRADIALDTMGRPFGAQVLYAPEHLPKTAERRFWVKCRGMVAGEPVEFVADVSRAGHDSEQSLAQAVADRAARLLKVRNHAEDDIL